MRKLRREVVHSRGELLFSKVIVLSEGETEEQALPELFEAYSGKHPFALGINFVGVNGSGAKYRPFFILAKDFNIPLYIFSDGEQQTIQDLKKHYEKVFGPTDINNAKNITILSGTDFEGYLLDSGFQDLIEKTIIEIQNQNYIENWINSKNGIPLKPIKTDKPPCEKCHQPIFESDINNYDGEKGKKKAIHDILDLNKPMYAKAISHNLVKLPKEELPEKIIELFQRIESCEGLK